MNDYKEYNFKVSLHNDCSYKTLMYGKMMHTGNIQVYRDGMVVMRVGGTALRNILSYSNFTNAFVDWDIIDRRVLIEKKGHSL